MHCMTHSDELFDNVEASEDAMEKRLEMMESWLDDTENRNQIMVRMSHVANKCE